MVFDPRTPVLVGITLIFALGALLTLYSPMPGGLSEAHAALEGVAALDGCDTCHSGRSFDARCLECHGEIQTQLLRGRGYHAYLHRERAAECSGCHAEHNGAAFALVNETSWGAQTARGFKHPHVEFLLDGAHDALQCEECHRTKLRTPFVLAGYPERPRHATFLGLAQECRHCHEDIHSGGFSEECDSCHGQESFRPPVRFDHSEHFALDGGHARVACGGCHPTPAPETPRRAPPFPFDKVRGTTCRECHRSPHRAILSGACDDCHARSEPSWSEATRLMTREAHARTGFELVAPHADVACDGCHPREVASAARYQDPSAPGYARRPETCGGCHADAHAGQFRTAGSACLDCHRQEGFVPTTFGHAAHAGTYPLRGPHESVPCSACHLRDPTTGVRRFANTDRRCKRCHVDPHGGQFEHEIDSGDCDSCHDAGAPSFRIRPFEHTAHSRYHLEGAHRRAECNACHVEVLTLASGKPQSARRYRGTPESCDGCHRDVHRGQFADQGGESCRGCHRSFESWREVHFDHDTQSRFPLRGAHAEVACQRCHVAVPVSAGESVIQYRPLGRECGDCHEIRSR